MSAAMPIPPDAETRWRSCAIAALGLLALALAAACGGGTSGSPASRHGPSARGASSSAASAADAGRGAQPGSAREDPLAALAGTYEPAGRAYPQLELAADGSYLLRRDERPGSQERGQAGLDDPGTSLELVPNLVGGTATTTELAIRRHEGRVVLLRGDEREAFDLVPSLELGMLRRSPSDAPGPIVLPDSEPRQNPEGAHGEPALPASFRVVVTFPQGSDRRSARVRAVTRPHRVELEGCETWDPNRECGGALRRTVGASAWVAVTRLWRELQPATGCAEPAGPSARFRIVLSDREVTGAMPAEPTDESLAGPCFAAARFAWWFARQVSLR